MLNDYWHSSAKRLNIRGLDLETEVFQTYFNGLMRNRGETLTKHINAEETAYRKLQRVLKEAMDDNNDEYSEDESGWYYPKQFQIPKRLRGWLFMERAQIPFKEHAGNFKHDTTAECVHIEDSHD